MTYTDPLPGNPWVAKATDVLSSTSAAQVYATLALAFETRTQTLQAQKQDIVRRVHQGGGFSTPELETLAQLREQITARTTRTTDEDDDFYPPRSTHHA